MASARDCAPSQPRTLNSCRRVGRCPGTMPAQQLVRALRIIEARSHGLTPGQRGISTEIARFADVPAFIVLKALALDDRTENKDAVDLIHVLRYAGAIDQVTEIFVEREMSLTHPGAIEAGLEALRRRFCAFPGWIALPQKSISGPMISPITRSGPVPQARTCTMEDLRTVERIGNRVRHRILRYTVSTTYVLKNMEYSMRARRLTPAHDKRRVSHMHPSSNRQSCELAGQISSGSAPRSVRYRRQHDRRIKYQYRLVDMRKLRISTIAWSPTL